MWSVNVIYIRFKPEDIRSFHLSSSGFGDEVKIACFLVFRS